MSYSGSWHGVLLHEAVGAASQPPPAAIVLLVSSLSVIWPRWQCLAASCNGLAVCANTARL